MDQLLSMGFSQDLASQALAATGGKSTLKATEWLLHQRAEAEKASSDVSPHPSKLLLQQQQQQQQQQHHQVRVDRFFSSASSSRPHGFPPPAAVPQAGREALSVVGSRQALIHASDCKDVSMGGNDFSQVGKVVDEGKSSRLDAQIASAGEKGVLPSAVNELSSVSGRVVDAVDSKPGRLFKSYFPPPPPSLMEPSPKRHRVEEEPENQAKAAASIPLMPSPASRRSSKVPLAERMRPVTIDEVVGQDHLLGPGCILRSLLQNDTVPSVIFWGPPGIGKTSLAKAISRSVSYRFVTASAVTSGVKEVREVLEEAKRQKKMGQRTLFFVDEVHRFNKAQQDAFLPSVEAGHVVFIGATTENPSFEVNGALLSRCRVLTLNKLQPESIRKLLERAISNAERGVMASFADDSSVKRIKVDEEALHFLAAAADGDARVALNALEVSVAAAVSREKQRTKPTQDAASHHSGVVERKFDGPDARKESVVFPAKERPKPIANSVSVKREFPLKLSALKESLDPSQDEYKRPFKKFVGGRQVTLCSSIKDKETASEQGDELAASRAEGPRMFNGSTAVDSGAKNFYMSVDPRDAGESSKHTVMAEATQEEGEVLVRLVDVSEALQRSHLLYDKTGEEHYNVISALHKSMRGGHPDAALYWLARMLEGGEGPLYVARRLIRFSSEDVGLADPQALPQAVACYQACHFLGMPECNVHLAQCVAYLSLAPKSVAVYQAVEAAQQVVKETGQNEPVPLHLRNAPTGLMKQLGYGKGYIYPPSYDGQVEQEYLPPSLRGHKFLKWP